MAISLDKINSALDRLDNKGGSNQNQDNIVKLDEGEHQLRADPVRAGNQDGVLIAGGFQVEQRAEAAKAAHHARAGGGFCQRANGLDQPFSCLNVDTGITVGKGSFGCIAHDDSRVSMGKTSLPVPLAVPAPAWAC